MHTTTRSSKWLAALETALPKIVVAPSFMVMVVFIYGFILWTLYLSMTKSSFLPSYDFVGLAQYAKLWRIERWGVAVRNLLVYGGLFIFFCTLFGLLLAIFLDQKIRIEGRFEPSTSTRWPCPSW
jgi:glucose/mannose transport system permease protein